ncbi:MAG: uroporphyrinogen-III synthase [Polyangia bacterium]
MPSGTVPPEPVPPGADRFLIVGRPLRVLITRPEDQADESAALVRAAGGEPLVCPCLRGAPPADDTPLRSALQALERFDAVAVTSAHAAAVIADTLAERARRGESLPLVAAVGARTAAGLRSRGVPVDLVGTGDGELLGAALLARLADRGPAAGDRGGRVLLPQAEEARDELRAALVRAGLEAEVVVAYRMVAAAPAELAGLVRAVREGAVDLVPFTSPRSAQVALAALGPDAAGLLRRLRVGAIGETTAAALRAVQVHIDAVPPRPTFELLLRCLAGTAEA